MIACSSSADHAGLPFRFLIAPVRANADAASPPSMRARSYHSIAVRSAPAWSSADAKLNVNDSRNAGSSVVLARTASAPATASGTRLSRASSFARSMRAKSISTPFAAM